MQNNIVYMKPDFYSIFIRIDSHYPMTSENCKGYSQDKGVSCYTVSLLIVYKQDIFTSCF